MADNDLLAAYKSVPIVTRTILTATILISIGTTIHLIPYRYIHRLFTPFFVTSVNFSMLFDLYFLYTYGIQLETATFGGRSADFAWFVIFSSIVSAIIAYYMKIMFLFQALLLSIIYLWSQSNSERIVSFMFGFRFKAVYFPWVLVAYSSIMMGAAIPWVMLIGIASAHIYYFLDSQYPAMGGPKLIPTPRFLYSLLPPQEGAGARFTSDGNTANVYRAGNRAANTGGHQWGTGHRLG